MFISSAKCPKDEEMRRGEPCEGSRKDGTLANACPAVCPRYKKHLDLLYGEKNKDNK